MVNLFRKNSADDIQKEWYTKGEKYAQAINEMVEFGETHGWENWKGKEPVDKREHLANKIYEALKTANLNNEVEKFRADFPPAHAPIISLLENKSQFIGQICFIDNQKVAFITGAPYQERQAYVLDNDVWTALDPDINAIGKSKLANIFAISKGGKISLYQGWEGTLINEFTLSGDTPTSGITELIPFNDGQKVLMVTSQGMFLITEREQKLIHPVKTKEDEDDEEWTPDIDMENATVDPNNQFIVAGDQCYNHRILDPEGNQVGTVGPQSSYPHFCLFSKDGNQLITNSCHFYNGTTIGVDTDKLNGIDIPEYEDSDDYVTIDDNMRVYAGVSTSDYYILGDAYGYIIAFDKSGKKIWRHFLGSTISGMALSDDEKTLWVGSYSGMLHKLQLGKGHRDTHTIGNGKHYEDFRLIVWKNEPQIWKW